MDSTYRFWFRLFPRLFAHTALFTTCICYFKLFLPPIYIQCFPRAFKNKKGFMKITLSRKIKKKKKIKVCLHNTVKSWSPPTPKTNQLLLTLSWGNKYLNKWIWPFCHGWISGDTFWGEKCGWQKAWLACLRPRVIPQVPYKERRQRGAKYQISPKLELVSYEPAAITEWPRMLAGSDWRPVFKLGRYWLRAQSPLPVASTVPRPLSCLLRATVPSFYTCQWARSNSKLNSYTQKNLMLGHMAIHL